MTGGDITPAEIEFARGQAQRKFATAGLAVPEFTAAQLRAAALDNRRRAREKRRHAELIAAREKRMAAATAAARATARARAGGNGRPVQVGMQVDNNHPESAAQREFLRRALPPEMHWVLDYSDGKRRRQATARAAVMTGDGRRPWVESESAGAAARGDDRPGRITDGRPRGRATATELAATVPPATAQVDVGAPESSAAVESAGAPATESESAVPLAATVDVDAASSGDDDRPPARDGDHGDGDSAAQGKPEKRRQGKRRPRFY